MWSSLKENDDGRPGVYHLRGTALSDMSRSGRRRRDEICARQIAKRTRLYLIRQMSKNAESRDSRTHPPPRLRLGYKRVFEADRSLPKRLICSRRIEIRMSVELA